MYFRELTTNQAKVKAIRKFGRSTLTAIEARMELFGQSLVYAAPRDLAGQSFSHPVILIVRDLFGPTVILLELMSYYTAF